MTDAQAADPPMTDAKAPAPPMTHAEAASPEPTQAQAKSPIHTDKAAIDQMGKWKSSSKTVNSILFYLCIPLGTAKGLLVVFREIKIQ